MEPKTLLMLLSGATVVAVPAFGWISRSIEHNHDEDSRWIKRGDFLRLDGEVVRVERIEPTRVVVRSHTNRLFYTSKWKLFRQNLRLYLPW